MPAVRVPLLSRSSGTPVTDMPDLVAIRAALAAGLAPVEALGAARGGPLSEVAAAARLGRPLAEIADERLTTDAGGQLLLRALAVAEHAGHGGAAGVEQALSAIREARATDRLLRVKTAQARGTARLMAAVPVAAWALLVGLDRDAVGFYTTPPGMVTGALALLGMFSGRWWSTRLIRRAASAAQNADPLRTVEHGWDLRRGLAVAAPIGVVLLLAGQLLLAGVLGLVAMVVVAAIAGRPRRDEEADVSQGGTAELVELLALALDSGLSPAAAVGLVAQVGPPAGRADLEIAHRRLMAGWRPRAAFERTRLVLLGDLLDAVEQWGAPLSPALRALAEDLRAQRRASAEEAAERAQLALVFPTTLLTLPAFALAIVPPLVWIGFAN